MHASSFDGDARDFEVDEPSLPVRSWSRSQADDEDDSPPARARELVAAFERFIRSSGKKAAQRSGTAPRKKSGPKARRPKSAFELKLAEWLKVRRQNGQTVDPYFPDSKNPSELFREQLQAGFDRAIS
jgi:hypothetical protein